MTTTIYRICRCGMFTTEIEHFQSWEHIVIDEVTAAEALSETDVRELRDFAHEFAGQWRRTEKELADLRRVEAYRRRTDLVPEYMLKERVGAFRGPFIVAGFLGVFAGLCALAVVIVRHGWGR